MEGQILIPFRFIQQLSKNDANLEIDVISC